MNIRFSVRSFVSELTLMHSQGKRLTLKDVEELADNGTLLTEIEKLGFNNYEFIDEKAKKYHFDKLNSIISELNLSESYALSAKMEKDCGLLYVVFELLNKTCDSLN